MTPARLLEDLAQRALALRAIREGNRTETVIARCLREGKEIPDADLPGRIIMQCSEAEQALLADLTAADTQVFDAVRFDFGSRKQVVSEQFQQAAQEARKAFRKKGQRVPF